mmetsp:Transcript_38472/g.106922  ORF Transcript_38472/g.106922 Transcript_38472/m.106922 type:complete len:149 (+) Transcript_38472:44-490(+)
MTPEEAKRRAADKAEAQQWFYEGAAKGFFGSGAVGIGVHLTLLKAWPKYTVRVPVMGRALLVTGFFVAGFAIGGEQAVQAFHKKQWARREAERLSSFWAAEEARVAQQSRSVPGPAVTAAPAGSAAAAEIASDRRKAGVAVPVLQPRS